MYTKSLSRLLQFSTMLYLSAGNPADYEEMDSDIGQ